jgi:hypothetical protein
MRKKKEKIYILVVPVTFGHPWVRHSSHPERFIWSSQSEIFPK